MPRFTALPVTVEAHQYQGNTLNLEGGFNAVITSYQPGGRGFVSYRGAILPLAPGDWLVRGPDGVVMPVTAAAFEVLFAPALPLSVLPIEQGINEHVRRKPGRPPGPRRHAEA